MARALVFLLQNEGARKDYGAAGLRRVRQHFSVERMVEETLAVYEELSSTTDDTPLSARRSLKP
jgi:glycosyltransferase involved in cell wall biosynthesis